MLTFVNKLWKFKSEDEMNAFLNAAEDANDDYRIENHGLSQRGEWYAFGSVVAKTKFGKNQQPQQQNAQAQVTTF